MWKNSRDLAPYNSKCRLGTYLRGAEAGAQDVAKAAAIRGYLPFISPTSTPTPRFVLLLAVALTAFSVLFFAGIGIGFGTSCFLALQEGGVQPKSGDACAVMLGVLP